MGFHLTLVLGGARSGKSAYALKRATELGGDVLFVATASPSDPEMAARIEAHRATRPANWRTLEVQREIGRQIETAIPAPDVIVLDCMTLLAGRALIDLQEPIDSPRACSALTHEIEALRVAYERSNASWFIISNEVGMGVVPETSLGRVYSDALGWGNQCLAELADEVVLMVAGLPVWIKRSI
jgi:adenosylcobinamide kinase/adenosylcobinamide-phosphate guanylyltransferase